MENDELSCNPPAKAKWFSIKEAAEYLDIGEPTLYRWMRDSKITYRKVGDSTRFWQEDIDAVMEVFHCGKDADKARELCPVCRNDELVDGRVQSTGLSYFVPRQAKFWTLASVNISTSAKMCARCGAIVWFGDTKKLAALRAKSNDTSSDASEHEQGESNARSQS